MSEERVTATFPGVKQLVTALDEKMPQEQFINLIKLTIEKAVIEAIDPIVKEMKEIRKLVEAGTRGIPMPMEPSLPIWPSTKSQVPAMRVNNGDKSDKEKAFDLAKRCVGLGPIPPEVVKKHADASNSSLDITTRNQIGGAFAIRDFLCKEMGMNDSEAENIRIFRTFRIPQQTNILYVEVAAEADLRKIRSRATNLSNGNEEDPRLETYIPNILQAQYSRLVKQANKGRAQTPKQASKIWVGNNEFELRFRPKGEHTPWNKIQPVNVEESTPFVPRQSLIDERAKLSVRPKSAIASSNNIWLNQESSSSPMTNFTNDPNNPNFVPVSKERSKVNYLGKTLLPISVTTSNRFQAFQGADQRSP